MVEIHQVARIMTERQVTSLVRAPTASVSNVLRRISLVVCGLVPDLDEDAERIENQRLILILRCSPTHLRNHIGPLSRFQVYLNYIYLLFHEYISIIQFGFILMMMIFSGKTGHVSFIIFIEYNFTIE